VLDRGSIARAVRRLTLRGLHLLCAALRRRRPSMIVTLAVPPMIEPMMSATITPRRLETMP
jgi:hypothetical protein